MSVFFDGAILVALTTSKERRCHCQCVAVGHGHRWQECQQEIPAGGEFHLALIERPLVLGRPIGKPRACYRDEIPVCPACAVAIRAAERQSSWLG